MTFKVRVVVEDETLEETVTIDVACLERDALSAETFGLNLGEAKAILRALQKLVVRTQVDAYLEEKRACSCCGRLRRIKGDHDVVFRSVFGKLILKSPRWHQCDCQPQKTKTFSPLAQLLPERTTPELLYLETKWASLASYGVTADLIKDVLPVDDKLNAATVRNHLHRVAQQQEDAMGEERFSYVDGCLADWAELPLPNGPLVVGLDGGYVKSTEGRWFEVVAGKSMLSFEREHRVHDDAPTCGTNATTRDKPSDGAKKHPLKSSKCFGFVHTYDEKARRRLYEVLSAQGFQANQKVIFLSDGGESLQDLQTFAGPEVEYVLDWFHVTMRLTVLKQTAKGLPNAGVTILEGRDAVLERLDSIKHHLWHGNPYKALKCIRSLEFDLEGLVYGNEEETGKPGKTIKNLYRYVGELRTYIGNNRHCIPNYGERYRNGERISTGFVESTINQVVSKRFCKKQQMRWTKRGAHLLLRTRTAVLNDDLEDTFRQWYPSFRAEASDVRLAA